MSYIFIYLFGAMDDRHKAQLTVQFAYTQLNTHTQSTTNAHPVHPIAALYTLILVHEIPEASH